MLRDAQLLCQDRTVTLGLGQQDHEIRIVQNGGNLRAGQQVLAVLGQG